MKIGPFLKKVSIELVQTLGNKRKSHRFQCGCYKWGASVCYLRTNLGDLMHLAGRIQNIKNKL